MKEREMQAQTPPMAASDEATEAQLRLAKAQGEAYARAIAAMKEETGVLQTQRVGDYEIGVTAEEAEGLYELIDGQLRWQPPKNENCHIEVAVRDAADGRFIPDVPVHVTVRTAEGKEVGAHRHEFLWHPWLYHYGRNWQVPGDGEYRIHVHLDPPKFMRHDKTNGVRYSQPADADFTIRIETGRKKSQ